MQTAAVIIILALAISYGGWRIYEAFRQANDPCRGCQGCELKALKQRQKGKKADCWHKK